jgi:hypothetical protein
VFFCVYFGDIVPVHGDFSGNESPKSINSNDMIFIIGKSNMNQSTTPKSEKKIKIGLYGIGLDTYWAQFEGLYDRLQGYQSSIAARMSEKHPEFEIINTGIVDNPDKARETGYCWPNRM